MEEVVIRRLSKEADGSGVDLIVMDTLPYPEIIHWTCITARDLITKCARVELLLIQARTEYILISVELGSKENTLTIIQDVYATGEYRIAARFIGAGLADDLELYAYGIVVPSELT